MATRPGYQLAEPCYLAKPQIQKIAEKIADQLRYKPGDDFKRIVASVGGRISVQTTLLQDPEHSGSLYVDGLGDFEIIVPSHTGLLRDRFTVAHELGHYFLHYYLPHKLGKGVPSKVVALRKGSNRIEWEANWFAAAFLMPESAFREAYHALNGNIPNVAAKFDVSQKAVEIRIKDLGLTR